ncbi:MAG: hypothetical protein ACPK85_06605, partial [Methanosarcina sp.]
LYVSEIDGRYSTLFNTNGWELAEYKQKDRILNETVSVFEEYILDNMDNSDKGKALSLWETSRLKQLKILLNVDKGKQHEKNNEIGYMDIKKFKNRGVLPVPEDV